MGNIGLLMNGFQTALTIENIGAAFLGAILGLIVGAMPGIGSLAGVALLLPLTYKFNPTTAIIMLGALYYSNMYGGSFSAILLNIPGDSPAVMTALDGYPMATKKKRPGQALFTANMSSFIGGTIGICILTFMGPALADIGLKFGPSEMTAILLIAMTSISWLVGENPTKGVVITMFGILLASMGMDTLSGSPRYDFGNMHLLGGIPFTPFIIGTVGFSQVISLVMERNSDASRKQVGEGMKLSIGGSLLTAHDFKRLLPPAIRSGFLGTFVGVLPGAGATTGSFMGYAMQKSFKSEEELGTGAIEGIAACEAANNAAAAGAFAPLLALGIPGSGTGAVLLGGLMMWGLNPGPLLFTNEPDFTWGLIASLFLSNILTLVIAICVIPFLLKILSVPVKYMIPCITCICMVGAYSSSYSMYGVLIMILSGIVAYFLQKNGYPTAPMMLSFVLAPLLESNMRKAFIISGGSLNIFFTRPITCVLMLIFLAMVATPIIKSIIRARKKQA
ncbi:MAG: tripartite tricarboxylate transporter permease [Lachnoclostridium edouardi]|uniref:tripartite tricarboxylate transporter permease n=1 Tax=Lachnoclostridium edouardi TaxID=1926283 RepID=UPI0026DA7DF9|nr:tripartite tricarboxylate transporter permease [Lachnoclostridium edouardi]MDO4278070.1 tripartite tricarboxylate transporter permease [Lachnoclostridium edouardi]